jgi:2-polyprenyl-3-methyl-5-hydroxy-6-metoxy-1,4-benzoquinol methylase
MQRDVETQAAYKAFTEGFGIDWFNTSFVPQTVIFYSHLLPIVHTCCVSSGFNPARICDIGAGSGAGADLIQNAMTGLLGWPTTVTAYDLVGQYKPIAAAKFPNLDYRIMDFFNETEKFNLAILSHTLEHIPDPEGFIQRLSDLVPVSVVFTPYAEKNLIPEHLHSFTEDRITSLPRFIWGQTFRSLGWMGATEEVTIFVCVHPEMRKGIDIPRFLGLLDKHFSHHRLAAPY